MNTNPGILVADDDENDLRMIEMALNRGEQSTAVSYVHDGGEALDYLYGRGRFAHQGVESPGLILLDLHMPRVDGWEVLKQVKADERLKWIPVVVFSSSAREVDVRHCYDLGANAYVVKPIDFEQFQQTIEAIEAFWVVCNQSLRPGSRSLGAHNSSPV
jgi:CheY-like chemotaxis protein